MRREPIRRIEKTRNIVVSTNNQCRRDYPRSISAQVRCGERLTGQRITLARAVSERLAYIAYISSVFCQCERRKPDWQQTLDQRGGALLPRGLGADRPHSTEFICVARRRID